jgi:RimJ/RimL family protein N-acetyltransferase
MLLRPVELSDVTEGYLQWMNDLQVTRFLECRFTIYSRDDLTEYVSRTRADPNTVFLAIVLREGLRHIGNIKLGPVDHHHLRGDVGLMIGDKTCWGKGYATEAISAVRSYAFDVLGLHKLTAGAYATNKGSIRAFQKAGFSIEGVRRAHYLSEGEYVDGILLGVVADECTGTH